MSSPSVTFLLARRQNLFFRELAAALCDELAELGVSAAIAERPSPADDPDQVYAMLPPHEYVKLTMRAPPRRVLGRTIFVCAEQPGSYWFEVNARMGALAGAVFDINPTAVASFRSRGLEAEHLPLGYTRRWDRFGGGERDIDISFLGSLTPRRERLLASYGPTLAQRRCHLVLDSDRGPSHSVSDSFVAGEDKRRLLARTKVLLNLHRDESRYFEWLRVVEAIHCGAAVVTEPSLDHAPLVEGEHFLVGESDGLARLAARVSEDDETRSEMSAAAYETLRESQPLSRAAERLAVAAERLAVSPARTPRLSAARTWLAVLQPARVVERLNAPGGLPGRGGRKQLGQELKSARLGQIELARRVAWLEETVRRGEEPPPFEIAHETSARATAEAPRVSVLTALYNHADHLAPALDSVVAGRFTDVELIVVDDGSTDDSGEVALAWLRNHDEIPGVLARHPANRGLPATRNTALELARGRYALVVDADNELLPNCAERLVEALEGDADAAFAYGILEKFDEHGSRGLLGVRGWDPARLRAMNYIDALALIRRSSLEEVGGFETDIRLYGWEDYDLWCKFAERGLHAVHVREIIARYRVASGSMITLTDLDRETPHALLRRRHPRLFSGSHGRRRPLRARG